MVFLSELLDPMAAATPAVVPAFDAALLLELLVAGGLISAIAETVRWFFGGRGRARVDNAKIVQGMALDLVAPLHEELDKANVRLTNLRAELEQVMAYAIVAHTLLEQNNITGPPPPPNILRR